MPTISQPSTGCSGLTENGQSRRTRAGGSLSCSGVITGSRRLGARRDYASGRARFLERFPITLNREALWFYRFGRIFFGKPAATFPENARAVASTRSTGPLPAYSSASL